MQVAVVELAHQVAGQAPRIQRLALLLRDAAADRAGAHEARGPDRHLVHDRRLVGRHQAHALLERRVFARRQRQPLELVGRLERGLAPVGRGVELARERGRVDVAELGPDVDVAGPEQRHGARDVLLGEQVHDLAQDRDHAGDLLRLEERRAHVHDDEHVGIAELARLARPAGCR